ncbi:hypothetical protein niasHS_014486 [Heterodera schachtii]|uniref:C4H2-type domain-containing protein n=1 Tax=Heterodera schachtii TaxID=97005 RepID=A0ABD2IBE5_HETSC
MEENDGRHSVSSNPILAGIPTKFQQQQQLVDAAAHQSHADSTVIGNSNYSNKNTTKGVVHALFTMAEARAAVTELGRCCAKLHEQCDQEKQVTELERTCDQVAMLLEEEKKVHQEELKQINQIWDFLSVPKSVGLTDLNLLDDFLRDRKPRLARKRAETERKMDNLLRNMLATIDVRRHELNDGGENPTTKHQNGQCLADYPNGQCSAERQKNGQFRAAAAEAGAVQNAMPCQQQFIGEQIFFWAFQWFMLFHHHHQQRQQQQQQLQQQFQQTNSSSNLVGTSSNNSLPTMVTTSRQNVHHYYHQHHHPQQQAKMKKCLFCFEEIHRNAPTCPFCKKKITSKAAKRVRK